MEKEVNAYSCVVLDGNVAVGFEMVYKGCLVWFPACNVEVRRSRLMKTSISLLLMLVGLHRCCVLV